MVNRELIEKAREFHGHICPYLVLGLRVAEIALDKLRVKRAGVIETIRGDIVAIIEDDIQVATGRTLRDNSLINICKYR